MTGDHIGVIVFLAIAALIFVWGVCLAWLNARDEIDAALEEVRRD